MRFATLNCIIVASCVYYNQYTFTLSSAFGGWSSGSETTKYDICVKTGYTWFVVTTLLFRRCGDKSPTRKSLAGSSCRWRSCFRIFIAKRNIHLGCGYIPVTEGDLNVSGLPSAIGGGCGMHYCSRVHGNPL